jgi:hypothetical protein
VTLGRPAPKPCGRLGVAPGLEQPEYGAAARHDQIHCAIPERFFSALSSVDVLAWTRLHGMMLGLRAVAPVPRPDLGGLVGVGR